MNQSASRPRLTRGAHDPAAHAYNIVGLFSQLLPLLAYIGRTLNDTMCDHGPAGHSVNGFPVDICDRCQRKLYTLGTLISGSATYVADWTRARRAHLDARLAIAAARRLVDTVELGEPVSWAMKGGSVTTTARHSINAAAALLNDPDLGQLNETNAAAQACREMDLSTCRVARKHGLEQESFIIGFVLKAASKAAEAAVAATESSWAQAGEERQARLAQVAEDTAGAAIGAALDGASLLLGTGRAEAMMVVATGVCAEYDRLARPADTFEKSTSQNATSGVSPEAPVWGGPYLDRAVGAALAEARAETPTEEYDVVNDFDESGLADVADEAIGDAAALAADLERAEKILNAIAEEHRAVECLVRTSREDGADASMVTEYYQDCCVMCRDAKGRPVPTPCRTMKIVQSFGEA